MSIEVARGVLSRIQEDPGQIVLQVQEACDPVAAQAALGRARAEIWDLDGGPGSAYGLGPDDRNGPKHVSEVLPAGTGPVVTIDGGGTPQRLLREIPEIVARHLAEGGVKDARIVVPARGAFLAELGKVARAVVLRLFPPPPLARGDWSEIPARWLAEACGWVSEDLAEEQELLAGVGSIEFGLPAGQALSFLEQCRAARAGPVIVAAGQREQRLCAAYGWFSAPEPTLALALGGPGCTDALLLAAVERLKELARRFAGEVGYALLSIDPTLAAFSSADHLTDWTAGDGAPGSSVVPLSTST